MSLRGLAVRPPMIALACGALGSIACAIGAIFQPADFLAGWLAALVFWISMPLGALALVQIHDLGGGRWGLTAAAPLQAAILTMPLFVVFFIPLAVWLPEIFHWARPEVAAELPNTFYLNMPFFYGRAALYFIVWNLFAVLSLAFSSLDGEGAMGAMNWVSGLGLLLLGFTATFASFDWVMSLDPHWSSTMFGLLVGSGQFALALALVTLAALMTRWVEEPGEGPLADRFHDLGSILLAVLLFWAYTEFMQLLIVWEENLRNELGWYLKRIFGAWGAVMFTIAACHFVIPFLSLIWTPVKRNRIALGAICALLLVIGLVNVWWLILPELNGFSWLDPLAAIAMGGWWAALFLWRLERGRLALGAPQPGLGRAPRPVA